MGEHNFLRLLARVIKLHKQVRIYNTGHNRFSYDLDERNGKLMLTIHYPRMGESTIITYDTKSLDEFESRISEAEKFLQEKQELTKRYI